MENTKKIYVCTYARARVHICAYMLSVSILYNIYMHAYIHARLYISILRLFCLFFNRENRNASCTTTPVKVLLQAVVARQLPSIFSSSVTTPS